MQEECNCGRVVRDGGYLQQTQIEVVQFKLSSMNTIPVIIKYLHAWHPQHYFPDAEAMMTAVPPARASFVVVAAVAVVLYVGISVYVGTDNTGL